MTEEDQDKEIAKMAREKSELRRKLVCLKNQIDEYRKALEQAHAAMSGNSLREDDDQLFLKDQENLFWSP